MTKSVVSGQLASCFSWLKFRADSGKDHGLAVCKKHSTTSCSTPEKRKSIRTEALSSKRSKQKCKESANNLHYNSATWINIRKKSSADNPDPMYALVMVVNIVFLDVAREMDHVGTLVWAVA